MSAQLTAKQIDFCKSYLLLRDAKAAALEAGYSELYACKKAFALLKQENISQKIAELESEYFQNSFAKLAYDSMNVLKSLIDPESDFLVEDRTKLAAIKEIFKYHNLEQKLNAVEKNEDTQFNIVFNEVSSRDS